MENNSLSKITIGPETRRLSIETLFLVPDEPEPRVLYKYVDGEDIIPVKDDQFNIVISRDLKKNIRISAKMAMDIARANPEMDVWYVNTYASLSSMKKLFCSEIEPSQSSESESESKPPAPKALIPNLFIHNVPAGEWNTQELARDVADRRRHWRKAADGALILFDDENDYSDFEDSEGWQYDGDTELSKVLLIINSFEFTTLDRTHRSKMAAQLLELHKHDVFFLIFSHSMRQDIEAGLPGRGQLGLLAAKAGVVVRLRDPFENLIRKRAHRANASNQPEKGIVHEAQMQRTEIKGRPKKSPGVFRNDADWPDYYVDPWCDQETTTGESLYLKARTGTRLKEFFKTKQNVLFTRGFEPTEEELAECERDGREWTPSADAPPIETIRHQLL